MALKTRYSPLQHLSVDNLYSAFVGLAPRERLIALVGLGLLVLLLVFLPFSLVSGKLGSMKREIAAGQEGMREVSSRIEELKRAQQEIQGLERRFGSSGSITSRVEGAARKAGLTVDQLKEKPSQETDFLEVNSVDVKVSGASLQQVVDFFYEIEQDPQALIRVRRVQLKPKFANRQLLDVTCEIATFALRKET